MDSWSVAASYISGAGSLVMASAANFFLFFLNDEFHRFFEENVMNLNELDVLNLYYGY